MVCIQNEGIWILFSLGGEWKKEETQEWGVLGAGKKSELDKETSNLDKEILP